MTTHKLTHLKPNAKNPRTISAKKATMLRNSLARFGDLSGIVFNRTSKQLVGGHQRVEAFASLGASDVEIERAYNVPSHTGTVAEGAVTISGERYAYREVEWDEATEKAANLAANKGAGEWDITQVSEWLEELSDLDFDLDLTMFDEEDRKQMNLPDAPPEDTKPDDTDHTIEEGYRILIECKNEAQQFELMERFNDEGLTCKPLIC